MYWISTPYNHRLTDGPLSFRPMYGGRANCSMADEPLFCHSLLVTSMESRGSFAFLSGQNEAINLIDDSKLLSFQVLHLLFLSIKQIDFIGFSSITKKIK